MLFFQLSLMHPRSSSKKTQTALLLSLLTAVAVSFGCHQTPRAPAVKFSQTEVDKISEEIQNYDWE
jgi:hypothetical protein